MTVQVKKFPAVRFHMDTGHQRPVWLGRDKVIYPDDLFRIQSFEPEYRTIGVGHDVRGMSVPSVNS